MESLLISRGYKPRRGKVFNCKFCKNKIYKQPYFVKKIKNHFCSRVCHNQYQKENAFNKNCVVCRKIFYCQPCQIKYRNRQTCSIKCRSELQKIKAIENRIKNGFTKHQIDRCIRYSEEAKKWRKSVFIKDNFTCQVCGIKGGYLEADHIKPFAYFIELRFDVNNGRALCRNCHNKTKISAKKMREMYG